MNLAQRKKIKNSVISDLWSIHDLIQNPVTSYNNYNFRGFSKIMFPSDLWCFHVFSQTLVTTPNLSKIGCFLGIPTQLSNQSLQVNTFSLYILKIILLRIFRFGPTAQICAKTPKFETPILLFLCTHAGGLLSHHSTSFFLPGFNRLNESLLHSPEYIQ